MSKKTAKRKLRSRRKKANHGKRPNSGRRWPDRTSLTATHDAKRPPASPGASACSLC